MPWAKTIKRVIEDGRMPPWGLDKAHYPKGGFSNDRSLSHGDAEKILAWVSHGAPAGEEKEAENPEAVSDSHEWKIAKQSPTGKPDVVFDMGTTFRVPKHGELDYQYFTVPTHFTEEKCVKAVEVHAGAVQVVHHAIVHISSPQGAGTIGADNLLRNSPTMVKVFRSFPPEKRNAQSFRNLMKIAQLYDPKTAAILGSYVPGEEVRELAPGTAICIPAGSTLTFELHYTPDDQKEHDDRTQIGLMFTAKPEREVKTDPLGQLPLTVPANDPNFHQKLQFTFAKDSEIVSLQPHAHKLAKRWKYELEYPDGRREVILSVPNYDYQSQPVYNFKAPICVPQGTKLHVDCVYDNSKWNPRNPHPDKPETITWGFQTKDEMMNGWLTYVGSKSPCAGAKK